jgi:hypothetical protein
VDFNPTGGRALNGSKTIRRGAGVADRKIARPDLGATRRRPDCGMRNQEIADPKLFGRSRYSRTEHGQSQERNPHRLSLA